MSNRHIKLVVEYPNALLTIGGITFYLNRDEAALVNSLTFTAVKQLDYMKKNSTEIIQTNPDDDSTIIEATI